MAVKFSQFVVETDKANVNYLVGWDGTENVQITPADLLGSYPSGSGAAGQVTFFSATSTVTGDNDFYWNNTNKRLGIGTTSPSSRVTISGTNNLTSEITLINTNPSTDNDWSITPYYNDQSLRFRTNGGATTVMTLEDNGNVGIGTASPSAKLHVDGTLIATGISQLGSGGSNVYLTSSSAGNVGVGTSSPAKKLHVRGSAPWIRIEENSASNKRLDLYVNPSTAIGVIAANQSAQQLSFQTSNTDRLRITNAGNIGIGTTSPQQRLTVGDGSGSEIISIYAGNTNASAVHFTDTNTSTDYQGFVSYNHNSDALRFGTAETERMRIDSNGNFGFDIVPENSSGTWRNFQIGSANLVTRTNNNNDLLLGTGFYFNTANQELYKNTEAVSRMFFNNDVITFQNAASGTSGSAISWEERMRIDSSGNVGIGTGSPDSKLHIEDTLGANIILNSNTGAVNNGIYMTEGTSSVPMQVGAYLYYNGSTNKFNIATGVGVPTDKLTILRDSGNVGIGTTVPSQILTVRKDSTTTYSSPTTGQNTGDLVLQNNEETDGNFNRISFQTNSSNNSTGDLLDAARITAIYPDHVGANPSGELAFETKADGGDMSEAMRIDRNGSVGIGTNNPSNLLELKQLGSNDAKISILKNNGSQKTLIGYDNGNGGLLKLNNESGTTNVFVRGYGDSYFNGGNVGIGISSPVAKLHVYQNNADDDTTAGVTIEQDGTGDAALSFLLSSVRRWRLGIDNNDADKFKISSATNLATNNKLTIDVDGNVGIGTSSPSKKLEVVSNNTYDGIQISGSSIPTLGIIDTTNNAKLVAYVRDSDATIGTETNHPLTINTNNTERMRIDSAGNVGIGSTSPTSRLTVAVGDIETSGVGYGLILKSPNGTRYRVTVDNSGNLSTTAV